MRVQAQQCVQLSITNHPFDLILLLSYSIYTYFLLYADISEPRRGNLIMEQSMRTVNTARGAPPSFPRETNPGHNRGVPTESSVRDSC